MYHVPVTTCVSPAYAYYRYGYPYQTSCAAPAYGYPASGLAAMDWHYGGRTFRDIGDIAIKDYGSAPLTVNIERVTKMNDTYRTALWTGKDLQVTVMSIGVGDDIGLEVHPTTDQFIRIEEGQGLVQMGDSRDRLDYTANAFEDYAIMIPAGKWHNVTNTGDKPMKVYAIYAPPEHPFGTVHVTKAEAMAAERQR
jgi:mannose-6-phosphate isomerase-like protein (cupin superfamily)